MIESYADILRAFQNEEAAKLDVYKLGHAPTIGAMYEGLSAEVIGKAIPDGLNLKVVSGFVVDSMGELSGQIDCMLVRGDGEQVPQTDLFKWPVWDVLAVFEVKKNLYGTELSDSFIHLRDVSDSYSKWLHGGNHDNQRIDIGAALRAFSRITGVHAPEYKKHYELPQHLQLIYYTVVLEMMSPVRIVLGYGGYKTEQSLRAGMLKFLDDVSAGPGYGIPSFPDLITCNSSSIVKITGQPYQYPMQDDFWYFCVSTPTNPLWIMLELLWAKIENSCGVRMPYGDDLMEEVFRPFIAAKPVFDGDSGGWFYRTDEFEDDARELESETVPWIPTKVTSEQFVVLNQLCDGQEVEVDDPELIDFLSSKGIEIDQFVKGLQRTGHVAIHGNKLLLTTQEMACVILPDGSFAVGENNSGRMNSYVAGLLDNRS